MTCIVGIASKGVVWLGGDSAATSSDGAQTIIADAKVFKKGEFVIGVCGSPKVMEALKFSCKIERQPSGMEDREFVANEFIPAFKKACKETGCMDEGEKFYGALLVGYRGVLHQVQGNFQIITRVNGYDAVGSGGEIALGSLHSTQGDRNIEKRLLKALASSTAANSTVRPPYVVVKTSR